MRKCWIHTKKNVSSELDTDLGEGNKDKIKFSAKQLSNRIQLNSLKRSAEINELPITPEHNQSLVNQS